jgi:hypothetical protein
MKINVIKSADKVTFNVSSRGRTSTKKYHILLQDMIKILNSKFDLTDYSLQIDESDADFLPKMRKAKYVFKKKNLDISVNYVKIDIPIVEAEFPPLVDEEKPKEEKASLSSEKLPIGLKKVKKKRTTKKKTEE